MSDVYGPIDFLILELPNEATEATAKELSALIEQGAIRLYDLALVHRDASGACSEGELSNGAFAAFAGARSGLLDTGDLNEAANALELGASGLVMLYENSWAIPFVAAARGEGIEVVASSRLPAQQIMDALDALESQD